MGICEEHRSYLNDDKVIHWFSQNAYIDHPKLTALPIGLGNQQYPHGNLNLLKTIIESRNVKRNLVFKNFSVDTNFSERNMVNQITFKNGFVMLPSMPQEYYFKILSESFFSISPPGNGIDCHRIWESLYLNTIPIVQNHTGLNQFKNLPILFIDRWEDITEEFLRKTLDNIKIDNDYIKELDINYWKTLL
jgi:hypothetical protein